MEDSRATAYARVVDCAKSEALDLSGQADNSEQTHRVTERARERKADLLYLVWPVFALVSFVLPVLYDSGGG